MYRAHYDDPFHIQGKHCVPVNIHNIGWKFNQRYEWNKAVS